MRHYHCINCHREWSERGIIKRPIHTDSGHETEIYECPACGNRYIEIFTEPAARGTTFLEGFASFTIGIFVAVIAVAVVVYLITLIF